MQWMPFVAQQLGAAPDDAQAIAVFYWDVIYPGAEDDSVYSVLLVGRLPAGRLDGHPARGRQDRLAVTGAAAER